MAQAVPRSCSGLSAGVSGRACRQTLPLPAGHGSGLFAAGKVTRLPRQLLVMAVSSGRPSVSTTPIATKLAVAAVASPPISYRITVFDALRFNGPAPELINGRLAMLGFLLGASREASTGETLLMQLSHVSIVNCLVVALWIYASMVPILAGAKNEAFGVFTPRAEIANGRAAMLGFAALLALEWKAGVAFF